MMQTPHHFYSPDPFERNLGTFRQAAQRGRAVLRAIQPSIDLWNASFFCGSCAALRRAALDEIGGVATETVTEDAHTALKLHRARLEHRLPAQVAQAAGLATESLAATSASASAGRAGWRRSSASTTRCSAAASPACSASPTPRRCCTSSRHPRVIFLIAPLAYPFFGLHIYNAVPLVALAYALPHLSHSILTNSRLSGAFRHSFWSEVYETCLAVYLMIPTTVALIAPHKGTFNVTAKGGRIDRAYFESKMARPYIVLTALNLAGFFIGAFRLWQGMGEADVLAVNLGWCAYNLVILSPPSSRSRWEQKQIRDSPRVAVQLPAMLSLESGIMNLKRDIELRGLARSDLHVILDKGRKSPWHWL